MGWQILYKVSVRACRMGGGVCIWSVAAEKMANKRLNVGGCAFCFRGLGSEAFGRRREVREAAL